MDFERDFLLDLRAGMWTSLKFLILLIAFALIGLMAWDVF